MNLETQEKISKLLREQAEKLGKALRTLRLIRSMPLDLPMKEARLQADATLREIADYGKDPKDL